MPALGSWSLISARYSESPLTLPFLLFVSISLWEWSVLPNVQWRSGRSAYSTSHSIFGDLRFLLTPPPPSKLSADQILLPHQARSSVQIWNLLPQLSELKGKGEDQRETLCRVAGLPVHFRATPGKTPMGEDKVHWDRLQCQGYVFWEVPRLHLSFYNKVIDYMTELSNFSFLLVEGKTPLTELTGYKWPYIQQESGHRHNTHTHTHIEEHTHTPTLKSLRSKGETQHCLQQTRIPDSHVPSILSAQTEV